MIKKQACDKKVPFKVKNKCYKTFVKLAMDVWGHWSLNNENKLQMQAAGVKMQRCIVCDVFRLGMKLGKNIYVLIFNIYERKFRSNERSRGNERESK